MVMILLALGGEWTPVIGHGCTTLEEADAYVGKLGGEGVMHVAREGEVWPDPPAAPRETRMSDIPWTPERQKIVEAMLEALSAPAPWE